MTRPNFVIGIGASAGGLQALTAFFDAVPDQTGMAFVVIQHLSPDFKSVMPELLARHTNMPIHVVESGQELMADHVYLNTPKHDVTVEDGVLVVREWDQRSVHHPIDAFFRSLAESDPTRSVAVILSGSGTDGAEGVRELHVAGGLAMVQNPESAQFDGMPRAALATDAVSFVGEAAELPDLLQRHAEAPFAREQPLPFEPGQAADGYDHVFALLRARFRIDFRQYKPTTAERRVRRRAEFANRSIVEYAEVLSREDDELDRLYWDLLIGVTRFFRDVDAFHTLTDVVIPKLIGGAVPGEAIRVWVAGCATGEEAYSIAILLAEALRGCDGFQVFATDVHPGLLRRASLGVFPNAAEEVPPYLLAKYFTQVSEGWRVNANLRQTVVFAPHDVLSDAPFSRVDLVACRNLLIYLNSAAQARVLARFHFALRKEGFLFLGPSETLASLEDDYDVVERRWKVFRKVRDRTRAFEVSSPTHATVPRSTQMRDPVPAPHILAVYDKILERFAPPGFLIDLNRTLLHTFGDATKFLSIPAGRVTTDILGLVAPALKAALGAAIHKVLANEAPMSFQITHEGAVYEVRVELLAGPLRSAGLLITFGEAPTAQIRATPLTQPDQSLATVDRVTELEKELAWTRETLQTTVEAADVTNEELQATNEELVAANEELQSTNEELQSVNEELHTVNAEYQEKNIELRRLSADLEQLLRSTELGVVFLDRALNVRGFTRAATQVFNLLQQDMGRPFAHITSTIHGLDLSAEAARVLDGVEVEERKLESDDGTVFLLRLLPYAPAEEVEGVVVSFMDITKLAGAEARARRAEADLRVVMDAAPVAIEAVDRDFRLRFVNPLCARAIFGVDDPAALVGRDIFEANPDLEVRREVLQRVLTGQAVEVKARQTGSMLADISYRPIRVDDEVTGLIGVAIDVTEREEFLKQLLRDAEVLDAVPVGVMIVRCDGDLTDERAYVIELANSTAGVVSGHRPAGLVNRRLVDVYPRFKSAGLMAHYATALRTQEPQLAEFEYPDDKTSVHLRVHARPMDVERIVVVHEDVTDEVRMRKQHAANLRLEAVGQIAGAVAHDLNNMLGAILMTGRALRAEFGGGDSHQEDLDAIVTMTHRAADLVARLLDFSRQRPVQPKAVAVASTVTTTLPMLNRVVGAEIEVTANTDAGGVVFIDPKALEQALINLATNARFAMENGGTLEIRTQIVQDPELNGRVVAGEFVELSVADTGVGMDRATLTRCFDPFFSTRPAGIGSGMGLAMVHGVITQAGGFVVADSELGRGTTIRMLLPVETQEVVNDEPRLTEAPASCRVLLVDDEEVLRRATARNLRRRGFTVCEAESGEAALRHYDAKGPFDVVVTDVIMPGMNGPALADALRAKSPRLPVIFVSGYSAHAAVRSDVWSGARYLAKPFDHEDLEAAIGEVVAPRSP